MVQSRTARVKKYFTILDWLPGYKTEWLRPDIIAALSVWSLLVPQGIAYSSIAGVPAQYGLYAALGALLGYAVFGSSGQVCTGPSAAIAAVSASVVAQWADSGSSEWIAYTSTLAVFAGLVYVVLGVLRMGWISHFLSGAVLAGFVFGFGFGLIVDQTPKILGIPKESGSYFQVLVGVVKDVPDTSMLTLTVGVLSILMLLLFRRFLPALPRTITVVVIGILVSNVLNLDDHGVSVVGDIPTGLPSLVRPELPPVDLISVVLGSLAIIFIGYSESLATAKEAGRKHGYEIDASQELTAQGMANVGSGLLGGYSVEGSLSKTTVADMAGQKTQLASLLTAGLILLTILLLTGFFTSLPDAVLGAVVIDAGISLIKFREYRHYRLSNRDFAAFIATALVVFFIGVLAGVVVGVAIALLLLIASASNSPTRQMAFDPEDRAYVYVEHHPDAELIPGIVIVGIHGPLFFADAENFRTSVEEIVATANPHTVVIDFGAVVMMDMDGVRALEMVVEALRQKQIDVLLVSVHHDNMKLMRNLGTLKEVGGDNVFHTIRAAVASAQERTSPPVGSTSGSQGPAQNRRTDAS
ncbi:MAG TPA: SulP family inorganic anion transporter [Thermomicrobiales bacterium]|nr:SulP family inorganic anion transporter [Thermomicrobiales bacterium]